jgi:hypothetical protein
VIVAGADEHDAGRVRRVDRIDDRTGECLVDHLAGDDGEMHTRAAELRTHCMQGGFARTLARRDGGITLRHSLVREEVSLMAGDEDDTSADRHQRHGHPHDAALGVAPTRCVEDQGVQPPETSRDGIDHHRASGLVGYIGAQNRGGPACVDDRLGNRLSAVFTVVVVHDDVGVRRSELPGDVGADAPRAAGDQDDPCR